MNSNQIRERWHASTDPFTFRLSDGTGVPVPHPDFMLMPHGVAQIVVWGKSGSLIRIDPMHVVAIEEGVRKSKGNGKRSH